MARARGFAERAFELDPNLGAAHAALANIRYLADWDFPRAEEGFKRSLELAPGSVWGHRSYAHFLEGQGRVDEAIEQMRLARDLDPLTLGPAHARLYERRGEPERAVALWQESSRLVPNYFRAHLYLGDHYCRGGKPKEGIPLIERAIELAPEEPWPVAVLGYCRAISGSHDEARKILKELRELSSKQYVTPMGPALIHVGLGENDQAFEWLERAYDIRALRLLEAHVDPRFQPLYFDPRFRDLLRRIGLV